jgi:hypothetical protein
VRLNPTVNILVAPFTRSWHILVNIAYNHTHTLRIQLVGPTKAVHQIVSQHRPYKVAWWHAVQHVAVDLAFYLLGQADALVAEITDCLAGVVWRVLRLLGRSLRHFSCALGSSNRSVNLSDNSKPTM